jgi:hypothetical protein
VPVEGPVSPFVLLAVFINPLSPRQWFVYLHVCIIFAYMH